MWERGGEVVVGGGGYCTLNLPPISLAPFFTCVGFYSASQFLQNEQFYTPVHSFSDYNVKYSLISMKFYG